MSTPIVSTPTIIADPCRRCVLAVLLLFIASSIIIAAIDQVLLVRHGYTSAAYNGSTLRSFREMARSPTWDNDSWKPMSDALVLLRSSERDRLYEKVFFQEKTKFQYPPTSLVYLAGLDALSLASMKALNAINLAVFAATCIGFAYLVCVLLPPSKAQTPASRLLTAALPSFLVALLYYPTVRALELGQIQVWINALFLASCIVWIRNAKVTAGVMLAIAATIKPQLGIFLVWFLLWREWRCLQGFLIAGIPIGIVSLLMFGLRNHLSYLEVLSFISQHGESFFANQSVNGLMNRALGNGPDLQFQPNAFAPFDSRIATTTFISSIVILAIALIPPLLSRRRGADILDLGIMAICATMASPVAWEHHYGILLPIFGIALVRLCSTERNTVALAFLSVSWILAGNYFPIANYASATALNFIQSYVFYASLMLLGVLLFLRNRSSHYSSLQLLNDVTMRTRNISV